MYLKWKNSIGDMVVFILESPSKYCFTGCYMIQSDADLYFVSYKTYQCKYQSVGLFVWNQRVRARLKHSAAITISCCFMQSLLKITNTISPVSLTFSPYK